MLDSGLNRDYKEDVYKFGGRLTKWREAAGLSQEQLAKALGVSQQAVSEWEIGKNLPRITRAGPLARHLGLTPGDVTAALAEEGQTEDERVDHLGDSARDVEERLRQLENP